MECCMNQSVPLGCLHFREGFAASYADGVSVLMPYVTRPLLLWEDES